jgi:hypothetical protein
MSKKTNNSNGSQKKKKVNMFTNEMIGYFGKPTFTKEDIIYENKLHDRMRELGIRVPDTLGEDSEDDILTDDEMEAMHYLYRELEVPEDLKQRLMSRKRVIKEVKSYNVTIPREEALRMLEEISNKKKKQ